MTTTIYLDTEFSDLTDDAELISVGAITAAGDEFYAELIPLPVKCSAFVKKTVLPLLEGGDAACPTAEFPARFAAWLRQWPAARIVVDSDWDIYLQRKTLMDSVDDEPGLLIVGTGASAVTAEIVLMPKVPDAEIVRYCDARYEQKILDRRLHHALADAKMLRAGAMARQDWQ